MVCIAVVLISVPGRRLVRGVYAIIGTIRQVQMAIFVIFFINAMCDIREMIDPYNDFRVWLNAVFSDLGRGAQSDLASKSKLTANQITRMKNLKPRSNKDTMRVTIDHYEDIVSWARGAYARAGLSMPTPPPLGGIRELTRVYGDEEEELSYTEDLSGFTREHYQPKYPGGIPELDLSVGAGQGTVGNIVALGIGGDTYSGHQVVQEWLLPERYLTEQLGINPRAAIVTEVRGDSMFPTFHDKDKVIVDLRQQEFLNDDAVYLISDGHNEPQIKRLIHVFGSRPPEVEIASDNPIVVTRPKVPLSDVVILGRVVTRLLRM